MLTFPPLSREVLPLCSLLKSHFFLWFPFYCCNSSSLVLLAITFSSTHHSRVGLPQHSILSPQPFSLFIISLGLSGTSYLFFLFHPPADNTQIWSQHRHHSSELQTNISHCLLGNLSWCPPYILNSAYPQLNSSFSTQMPAQFLCVLLLVFSSRDERYAWSQPSQKTRTHPQWPPGGLNREVFGSRWTGDKMSVSLQRVLHLSENETWTCCLFLMAPVAEVSVSMFSSGLGAGVTTAWRTEVRHERKNKEEGSRAPWAPRNATATLPSKLTWEREQWKEILECSVPR